MTASRAEPANGAMARVVALSAALPVILFAATLFATALLLASVQPLVARLALPTLGGAPAVWAVVLCFAQSALLAGTCYAHMLMRLVTARTAVFSHVGLSILTLLALPISLPRVMGEAPVGVAADLWLVGALAMGVGLPCVVLSANGPLLQSWIARTGCATGTNDRYSTGASPKVGLLVLLAYPLMIEPALGLAGQTPLWSTGFALLALAVAGCGALTILGADDALPDKEPAEAKAITPSRFEHGLWVLLSAVPAGLTVAVTMSITTGIAAVSAVWVVPSALALLACIAASRPRPVRMVGWLSLLLPALLVLHVVSGPLRLATELAMLFVATLACQRELHVRRPASLSDQTFHLWTLLGSAAGGIFAALVAPRLFPSVTLDIQLFAIAALFCVPGVVFGAPDGIDAKRVAGLGCLATACVCVRLIVADHAGVPTQQVAAGMIALAAATAVALTRNWVEQRIVVMMAVAVTLLAIPDHRVTVLTERSFFGTTLVVETPDRMQRQLLRDRTLLGMRQLRTPSGEPIAAPEPSAYHEASTPLARGFDLARAAKTRALGGDGRLLVGAVGLGTGALACHTQTGDGLRIFEIDPGIVKIARNPGYFDYLSRCAPSAPIIIGDARSTLAQEPEETFDYLVLDAVASGNVPAHLLTAEGVRMALSKLSDTGLLAIHVTSSVMDLVGALSSTLGEFQGVHGVVVRDVRPDGNDVAVSSVVVMVSRNPAVIEAIIGWPNAEGMPRTSVRAWTDDYADVLSAILRQLTR